VDIEYLEVRCQSGLIFGDVLAVLRWKNLSNVPKHERNFLRGRGARCLKENTPRGNVSRGEAKISVEITADMFVEAVNDSRGEGGCGDRRSRRRRKMDPTARRAVGGVFASFAPRALCN
jgi:hypothetical protein